MFLPCHQEPGFDMQHISQNNRRVGKHSIYKSTCTAPACSCTWPSDCQAHGGSRPGSLAAQIPSMRRLQPLPATKPWRLPPAPGSGSCAACGGCQWRPALPLSRHRQQGHPLLQSRRWRGLWCQMKQTRRHWSPALHPVARAQTRRCRCRAAVSCRREDLVAAAPMQQCTAIGSLCTSRQTEPSSS